MDPTGKDKRTRSPEYMRVRGQGGQQGWQRREEREEANMRGQDGQDGGWTDRARKEL